MIGDRSNSHTPPFLLTYEIYNRNLHNCLIDSGASSNIMLTSVCSKLNIEPQKSAVHIVQLDRTKVQVLGETNSVTIRLSTDPRVVERIDIVIADIPEFYGLILSKLMLALCLMKPLNLLSNCADFCCRFHRSREKEEYENYIYLRST